MMNEIDALSSRIEKLEHEARRGKRLKGVLFVVVGSLIVVAFQRPANEDAKSKIVQAREFRLLDENGKIRGKLGSDDDTPAAVSLKLYRSDGDYGVRLLSDSERSELTLDGNKHAGAIWMDADGQGSNLSLLNPGTGRNGVKWAAANLSARALHGSLTLTKGREVESQEGTVVMTDSVIQLPQESPEGTKTNK